MNSRRVLGVLVISAVSLVGCGVDNTAMTTSTTEMSHTSPVVVRLPLAPYGGCADAVFHAIGNNSEQALVIVIEARDRSTTEPTVLDFTLPDPAITVTLQRGAALEQIMCNDVIGPEYRVDSEVPAVAGSVRIELGPRTADWSGSTTGLATTQDIVMQDGTYLVDLYISTDQIGTYAG